MLLLEPADRARKRTQAHGGVVVHVHGLARVANGRFDGRESPIAVALRARDVPERWARAVGLVR